MQLWERWSSSCGIGFYKDAFCDRNIILDTYRPYLHDRLPQPWSLLGLNEAHTHAHNHMCRASFRRRRDNEEAGGINKWRGALMQSNKYNKSICGKVYIFLFCVFLQYEFLQRVFLLFLPFLLFSFFYHHMICWLT